jgi:PAS domain S-box-containing protein
MTVDIFQVRRALQNEEIVPCFQPLIELHTGRLTGFEVLARWQHPELGLILPKNFIPLIEEDGQIGLLMQQMLRKAFQSAPDLPDPLVLAVNVSPIQLRNSKLPGEIRQAAAEGGFPLERLTIEVTESALVNNLEQAKKIACELKDLGCRLALDDFGTGYSSLLHLQALPFDELKVDASFVSAMAGTRESRKIVAAIVGLGHSLGLITVGEGIETEEQAEMLLHLGCELGQGWLYGRAMPADEIRYMIGAEPQVASARVTGDRRQVSSLEARPTQRLAQLQAIYDGAPVGLCFLDRNLRYVSLNRRLAEMNGVSVACHLGKTVKEIIPESYPRLEPYLLRALHGEAISEVEVLRPGSRPGDAEWTAKLSYQPALDESGEVIGVSVAVADVTRRSFAAKVIHKSEAYQWHFLGLKIRRMLSPSY